MQPFSKRQPPPHAPRQVFHRQEAVGQASYTPQTGYSYAPPAPSSLAPVAMNQYAQRDFPTGRGVAHTSTVHVRSERPSWRTGAMILLAGVFVGGTFGVGVQARRNAMEAQMDVAAAAAVAPPTQVAAPVQASQPAQAVAAPGPTALQQTPPQAPPQAYAQAPAAGLPPGAIVLPPQPGVTVVAAPQPAAAPAPVAAAAPAPAAKSPAAAPAPAKAAPAPAPKKRATWRAPSRAPHGGMVAAKVQAPPKAPPPPPAEKPAPKKATSDAQKILQDAIGETTNTL